MVCPLHGFLCQMVFFNISVSDLEEVTERLIIKFADDTKLEDAVSTLLTESRECFEANTRSRDMPLVNNKANKMINLQSLRSDVFFSVILASLSLLEKVGFSAFSSEAEHRLFS